MSSSSASSERKPLIMSSAHQASYTVPEAEKALAPTTPPTMSAQGEVEEVPGTSRATMSKKTIWQGVLTAILMGFGFGYVFEKSRVFEPVNIRRQFLFERWLMLKMFLAAMAASASMLLLAYKFHKSTFDHIRDMFHGCYQRGIITAVALGGFMLGAGMAIGGACPGMVAAQLGAGVPTAYATFIGAFAGALAYGFLEPVMTKWIDIGPKFKAFHLDEVSPIPYWVLAVGQVAMSVAVIIVLEVLEPWEDETGFPNEKKCYVFACKSWPPWASGIIVGLLQGPAIHVIRDTLGSSTAYGAVCSLTTHALPDEHREKHFSRFASMRIGWGNWWQVIYLAAAIIGALVSAVSSGVLGDVHGIHPAAGFIGGFLMLFGSRLAGGCTSGHGISGFTLGNLASFVAVPFMFAGGIAAAFIFQAADPQYPL
ncbi:hypothetical protein PTSG_06635 [Salpingoeca rosetta]|uniref:Uncharacterized protein n=1 Tax=Salpingoeca rosetta (strain ATCC 50818 / BSB-021) TaxID=946362 RepID=F2UFJ8_SALR5|nr:uncharacterized protein PTSG_06635 [Salpingoeca rosetta]EGD75566.1 hypothetical protein PTSG_06635 [Salpingoeca rosetta]|eukprot:XP_004992023.1 hypothetical protein PTSG_06635 [Salpingoeca rosetta]